jgi:hypothetical protein
MVDQFFAQGAVEISVRQAGALVRPPVLRKGNRDFLNTTEFA